MSRSVTGGGEGIIDVVAKAGIMEDAVMKGVRDLEVDMLLWHAERHDVRGGAAGAHLQHWQHGARLPAEYPAVHADPRPRQRQGRAGLPPVQLVHIRLEGESREPLL